MNKTILLVACVAFLSAVGIFATMFSYTNLQMNETLHEMTLAFPPGDERLERPLESIASEEYPSIAEGESADRLTSLQSVLELYDPFYKTDTTEIMAALVKKGWRNFTENDRTQTMQILQQNQALLKTIRELAASPVPLYALVVDDDYKMLQISLTYRYIVRLLIDAAILYRACLLPAEACGCIKDSIAIAARCVPPGFSNESIGVDLVKRAITAMRDMEINLLDDTAVESALKIIDESDFLTRNFEIELARSTRYIPQDFFLDCWTPPHPAITVRLNCFYLASPLGIPIMEKEYAAYQHAMNKLIEWAPQPYFLISGQQRDLLNILEPRFPWAYQGIWGAVSRVGSYWTQKTGLNLAITAVTLETFRENNGSYPQHLDQMRTSNNERYLMDWFSGSPLRYESDMNSYVLYSVGIDGNDDGGVAAATRESRNGLIIPIGDLVVISLNQKESVKTK